MRSTETVTTGNNKFWNPLVRVVRTSKQTLLIPFVTILNNKSIANKETKLVVVFRRKAAN